jgi:hypothetical protein
LRSSEWKNLYPWLLELRQVSEANFKRWRKERGEQDIGRPEWRMHWSIHEQLNHMHSEVSEIYKAIRVCEEKEHRLFFAKRHIIDEISDCIYSSITAAHILGYNDEEILKGLSKCLKKIQNRLKE